jgi:hypothetical protein
MLSVIYADCRRQTRYAECRYSQCRYARCHCAECRGALKGTQMIELLSIIRICGEK